MSEEDRARTRDCWARIEGVNDRVSWIMRNTNQNGTDIAVTFIIAGSSDS